MSTKLITALRNFSYKYDLGIDQGLGSLKISVAIGSLDSHVARSELRIALEDVNTDWRNIAYNAEIIEELEHYSNEEIKQYICYLIYDLFFPEEKLSEAEIEELKKRTLDVLCETPDEWVSAGVLFEKLKQFDSLKRVKLFHRYHLMSMYSIIEMRSTDNKNYLLDWFKVKRQYWEYLQKQ
jgi:hypothetical protein